jgi:tRNA(Ile2) C34 agmatinyltransferase TiaS
VSPTPRRGLHSQAPTHRLHTSDVDDERAPICPVCGVTMLPAALSAGNVRTEWICVECEESGEPDAD